jgi:hypothetical protein
METTKTGRFSKNNDGTSTQDTPPTKTIEFVDAVTSSAEEDLIQEHRLLALTYLQASKIIEVKDNAFDEVVKITGSLVAKGIAEDKITTENGLALIGEIKQATREAKQKVQDKHIAAVMEVHPLKDLREIVGFLTSEMGIKFIEARKPIYQGCKEITSEACMEIYEKTHSLHADNSLINALFDIMKPSFSKKPE